MNEGRFVYICTMSDPGFPGLETTVFGDRLKKPNLIDRLWYFLKWQKGVCYTGGEAWHLLPSGWIREEYLNASDR